jgi:hypothetical protein
LTSKTQLEWWKKQQTTNNEKCTKRRKTMAKHDKPKHQQLFLDFGQKNFDAQVCDECGMMYVPGLKEDADMHAKAHKSNQYKLVTFPNWKSCRVVKEYIGEERVILIPNDDLSSADLKKVVQVRKLMDTELGFVDSVASNTLQTNKDQKTYLYIDNKNKVIGCVVAERIDKAYTLIVNGKSKAVVNDGKTVYIPQTGNNTITAMSTSETSNSELDDIFSEETTASSVSVCHSNHTPASPHFVTENVPLKHQNGTQVQHKSKCQIKEPVENDQSSQRQEERDFSLSCGNQEFAAECGVSRIWTHCAHRRQGVATRLLDAVRSTMIYGYTVPKNMCAFSQPTADGRLFFEQYTSTKSFLVYL